MIVKLLCSTKDCNNEVDGNVTDEVMTLSDLLAEERLCHSCHVRLIESRREVVKARQASIDSAIPLLTTMSQELAYVTNAQLADPGLWNSLDLRLRELNSIMEIKFHEDMG